MRKLIIALVAGLSLAACDDAQTARLKEIQAQAVAVCGFVPDAITIATIIPGASIYTAPVGVVAGAICAAISNVKLARRGAAQVSVKVNVPGAGSAIVTGHFAR